MSQRRILKATLILSVTNGVGMLLAFARGIYTTHILSPEEYGLWTLMVTLISYAAYADVGINTGMLLEMPKLISQGRIQEAQTIKRHAFSGIIIVTGLLSSAVVLISAIFSYYDRRLLTLGSVIAVAIFIYGILNYYNVAIRVEERFNMISLSNVITAAVSLSVLMMLPYFFIKVRVEEVALALLFGYVAGALILAYADRFSWSWQADWPGILRLIKVGLPPSLVPIGYVLFQSLDCWLMATQVPHKVLGYYGIGVTMGSFLLVIPNTLAYVLFTKQLERHGKRGNPEDSANLVWPPIVATGVFMGMVAATTILAIPAIIYYFFPAYVPGTQAACLLTLGYCALFIVPIAGNFLIAMGKQSIIFFSLGLAGAIKIISVLSLTHWWGIDGAACGVCISHVAYSGTLALCVLPYFGGRLLVHLKRIFFCFIPLAIMVGIAGILAKFLILSGRLGPDLVALIYLEAFLLAFLGGAGFLVAWATGFFRHPWFLKMREAIPVLKMMTP